jgi:hypothetical protein
VTTAIYQGRNSSCVLRQESSRQAGRAIQSLLAMVAVGGLQAATAATAAVAVAAVLTCAWVLANIPSSSSGSSHLGMHGRRRGGASGIRIVTDTPSRNLRECSV